MNRRVHGVSANWTFQKLVNASQGGNSRCRNSVSNISISASAVRLGEREREMDAGCIIIIHTIRRRNALQAIHLHRKKRGEKRGDRFSPDFLFLPLQLMIGGAKKSPKERGNGDRKLDRPLLSSLLDTSAERRDIVRGRERAFRVC